MTNAHYARDLTITHLAAPVFTSRTTSHPTSKASIGNGVYADRPRARPPIWFASLSGCREAAARALPQVYAPLPPPPSPPSASENSTYPKCSGANAPRSGPVLHSARTRLILDHIQPPRCIGLPCRSLRCRYRPTCAEVAPFRRKECRVNIVAFGSCLALKCRGS